MKCKKRILIISQFFWPDNFRINDVIGSLSDKKYDITVITAKTSYTNQFNSKSNLRVEIKKFPNKKFIIFRVPVFHRVKSTIFYISLNYLSFIFSGIFFGIRLLKNKKFDKIFVYGTSPIIQSFVGLYFKKKLKIPIIIWVQDLWPESIIYSGYIKNYLIINFIRYFVDIIYKNANVILLQSKGFFKFFRKNIYKNKIIYLPNPCEKFLLTNKKNLFFKKSFNIVYAGNFGVAQNLSIVLKAANLLKQEDVSFYFFGDNSRATDLLFLKKKLNLTNCFFPGYLKKQEFFSTLNQASALVFGLKKNKIWSNTIPSKLQSYMSIGVPIIAYIDGISKKIIRQAQCGIVNTPNDYKGLAKSILKLKKMNKTQISRYKKNAMNYSNKHFNLIKISNKLQEVLDFDVQK